MSEVFTLTSSPVLQQQPCGTSCVPTSIAIALGTPVEVILDKMRELGLDCDNGFSGDESAYLLTTLGIGGLNIPSKGIALQDGHYLACVSSLNALGSTHCVFVYVVGGEGFIYDPNNGKEGKKFYTCWDDTPMHNLTKLDDFAGFKRNL